MKHKLFSLVLCLLLPACAALAQISGTITDAAGARISGATVTFHNSASTITSTSSRSGEFHIDAAPPGMLTVRAHGFSDATANVEATTQLNIKLSPAPIEQRITVSSDMAGRIPASPQSQFIIAKPQVDVSGALSIDQVLKQVPGFTLFRRTGALYANPTAQGASLRGVGASGASRAAVMLDGIPLGDPFGSWVYWNRISRQDVQALEVLNGGGSDVFGSGALGGVVNVYSRHPTSTYADLETSYGTETTPDLSLSSGVTLGKWEIDASGQALRTQGYILVPHSQRGAVDTPAGTGDLTGSLGLARDFSFGRAFIRGQGFSESRNNGTVAQFNNTRLRELDAGADFTSATAGAFSFRAYGSDEIYNQSFSSIAADRNSEQLVRLQRVPASQGGFAVQWTRNFASRNTLSAALEGRVVHGHSAEQVINGGVATRLVDAGGTQNTFGFSAQDALQLAPTWLLTIGGRIDNWNNKRGFSDSTPLGPGKPTLNQLPDRTESAFSPRISLTKNFGSTAVSAGIYRAFRAPTLNELYRGFRVGNVNTNANSDLRAERLTGGEFGISTHPNGRLTLRGDFYWAQISRNIANVTLSTTPALITRQRQNLGDTRSRGVEFAADAALGRRMTLTGSYMFTDPTVLSFRADRTLEGNLLPQIPQHQFTFQWTYVDPRWTFGVQGRSSSRQFDDDQNLLPLDAYFTLDAQASRRVNRHADVFFAAENLTNQQYQVGRTPTLTLGPPITVRGGLRLHLGEH